MEIIIGKYAGFCYGANRAVMSSIESAKKEKVYCLGEIVHNHNVTNMLKSYGVVFIDNIEQANSTTIIRAHGEPKSIYKKAKMMGINLVDLTCPSVLKIHGIVNNYAKDGFYIIITGKNNHPEVIGIESYAKKDKYKIISNINELKNNLEEIMKEKNILLISQTTFNLEVFKEIEKTLKENLSNNSNLVIKNTICLSTENRQKEAKKIAQNVDAMIVVGDKRSYNTNKLYDIACKFCKKTFFISDETELDLEKLNNIKKVGITGGASTPKEDILRIKELLINNNG